MLVVLSHPDELLNRTLVDSFYSGVSIRESSFFESVLQLQSCFLRRQAGKLERDGTVAGDWVVDAMTTIPNAFYMSMRNRFVWIVLLLHWNGVRVSLRLMSSFLVKHLIA
jgi:hypothetical protein